MEKLKRFWNNLKLRLSLLRIWFMKNIVLFIRIFCIVCIICMFTGVINESTPLFGKIIYPFFEPLVSEITTAINEKDLNDAMGILTVVISVLVSTGTFILKVRRIALDDIKSDKLKLAMYKANMYFNQDGVLTKRIEKATGEDLDMDGKIDDSVVDPSVKKPGLISNIITSVRELKTIMSVEFTDNDEENKKEYDKIVTENNMEDSKEVIEEVEKILEVGKTNLIVDQANKEINNRINNLENSELTADEKTEKISIFRKVKEMFSKRKKDIVEELDKEDSSDIDIITNNIDEHTNKLEPSEIKVEKPVFELKNLTPSVASNKVSSAPKVQNSKEKTVDDFLEKLKNRHR